MPKQPDKRKTFAVIAGVGRRNGDHENMAITATDAMRVKNALVDCCPFMEENCHCLTNRTATKDQLIDKLKQLAVLTKTERADLVVVYISAHGCLRGNEFYIVCNDSVDYDLPRTALSREEFIGLLDEINTDKLLLLLDCCHANGIHKPEAMTFDKTAFLQKPNRLVLAASHAKQVAYLSTPVSIFTFAVIEALAGTHLKSGDVEVDVFGLAMYVRERVVPLSGNKQTPQLHVLRNSNTTNFVITRHPAGKMENVFKEGFRLLNEVGKEIPLGEQIEEDINYRQQFNWLNITNYYQEDNSETNQYIDNSVTHSGDITYNIFNICGPDPGSGQQPNTNILPADMPNSSSILDIILLMNNQLLFIERSRVKNRLEKMLIGDAGPFLILKGLPETGLSYLSNFFSEVGDKYGYYEYHNINLSEVSKAYRSAEMIWPWQIAKVMSCMMDMDYTVDKDNFDVFDFLRMLRREVAKHAREGRRFFFYIDQFNVSRASGLHLFMQLLAKFINTQKGKIFLAIGGYPDVDNWPLDLRNSANPFTIGTYFNRTAVDSFLKKLYNHEAYKFHERMNWDTFLESTRSYLQDPLFETPDIPNVAPVGDVLSKWFSSIRDNLKL